jgi:3(or 17)beta-hydroxysteroid dehydrogenase
MTDAKRLDGKVGLITGAARGIGEGIARAMAAEGAVLFLADIDMDAVSTVARSIGATALQLDVTNEGAWQSAATAISGAHGRLNILINNAGTEVVKALEHLSLDDIRLQLAVNLEGPMLGCKSMISFLKKGGKQGAPSSVINIASVAGMAGQANLSAYSASKAAVGHLAKSLAVEWALAGHAVRVNAIYPGCIQTPMLDAAVAGWVREGILDEKTASSSMRDLSPMKQIGEVADIAMGAVYLASDEAKFVTGTSLVIDGGWMAA